MRLAILFFCLASFNFSLTAYEQNFIETNPSEANPIELTVPGSTDKSVVRNPFVADLLDLITKNQGYQLKLNYHKDQLLQGRALRELSSGQSIDLTWSVTTTEREKELRAIKIPIYQGLIGWRVAFIHPNSQSRFSQVRGRDDLKQFVAAQRFDWPDFEILKDNGLPVEGNISFVRIPKALQEGLVDYFPRSVLEVAREAKRERNQGLIVENNLLLKYKSAYYFFVNHSNTKLANIIERGFKQALSDGSYQLLFNKYYGKDLAELQLDKRKVIELNNPTILKSAFESEPLYWYPNSKGQ